MNRKPLKQTWIVLILLLLPVIMMAQTDVVRRKPRTTTSSKITPKKKTQAKKQTITRPVNKPPKTGISDDLLHAVDSIVEMLVNDTLNSSLGSSLLSITAREESELPASALYHDWDNRYAHKVTKLPNEYRIDLRSFCMPTPSRVITADFGQRMGRIHKGLDIKVYIGDTIRAAFSGKVRVVRYEAKGYGYYVVIRHYNGLETIYGHLSKHLVKENQVVRAGAPIGLGGNTGRSMACGTGSHLHFETCLCGVALNPALFFDFQAQDMTGDFYTYRKSSIDRESAEATRKRGKNDGNGFRPEDVTGKTTTSTQR